MRSAVVAMLALTLVAGCSTQGDPLDTARQAVTERDYDAAASHALEAAKLGHEEASIIVDYAPYGDQMLHAAFWERDERALSYLASLVADVDVVDDRFGAPVLVLAAAWAEVDMVEILLDAGADPNAGSDKDGLTALLWAVKQFDEQVELVRMLLEAGADVTARSQWGETALDLADQYGGDAVASLLRDHGATE